MCQIKDTSEALANVLMRLPAESRKSVLDNVIVAVTERTLTEIRNREAELQKMVRSAESIINLGRP